LETCSYRFDNPLNIQYKAGQYFFVTIKTEVGEYRHHFSFSSSPTELDYLEFSTKLRDTDFKNALRELKIGDKVLIKAPAGEFTLDDNFDKIGMITGGIGITPFRSISKYCTDKQISKNIILLYGNHSEKDITFIDDFDKMKNLNQNLKVTHVISEPSGSWKGYTGRINLDMLKKEIPDFIERQFYLSGPQGMVQAIDKLLLELEIPKKQIKKEVFPRY
jgi:ferredoxin-NADP reductase